MPAVTPPNVAGFTPNYGLTPWHVAVPAKGPSMLLVNGGPAPYIPRTTGLQMYNRLTNRMTAASAGYTVRQPQLTQA